MLKIAAIKVDVTPSSDGVIGFLPVKDMLAPRDPLFARLFLIECNAQSTLVVSLDYGGLYCSTQVEWQHRLAQALGIADEHVLIHCEHMHDAPFIFKEAADKICPGLNWDWMEPIISKMEEAARQLPGKLQEVKELGWSETRLSGYASNRNVKMPDGSNAIRYSRCDDPDVRKQPVGLIDPMLRTLGFYASDKTLICSWNFYATHPQVANEGKRYSADAPGEAMRQLEERFPNVMCAFFNGCFGNVTAGKFSSPTDLEWNISHFGTMLADGIARNMASQEIFSSEQLQWNAIDFPLPALDFTEDELQKRAYFSPDIPKILTSTIDFYKGRQEMFSLRMLTLGDARIIFQSSELYIEYQLYSQALVPNEKLAIVGNCGGDVFYVGPEDALANPTGYEMQSYRRVTPEFARLYQNAAKKLLVK